MRQPVFCGRGNLSKPLVGGALIALLGLTGTGFVGAAAAQELQVPQASPAAKVEQRVGISDFSVQYSSPAVKGRKIWGELVPEGKPWRAGANAATKLTASHNFTFGGKAVPAGTYALYAIPGKDSWTLALNTSTDSWGVYGLDTKKDVARVTVKPVTVPARERLTYIFSDTTDDTTRLDLEWDQLRASVPLKVDTKSLVAASIDKTMQNAWQPTFTAARYYLENGDPAKALTYADASIAVKPHWWNHWVRAQALHQQGKNAEASESAAKAQQLGKGDRTYESFFKPEIAKALAEWKKKS